MIALGNWHIYAWSTSILHQQSSVCIWLNLPRMSWHWCTNCIEILSKCNSVSLNFIQGIFLCNFLLVNKPALSCHIHRKKIDYSNIIQQKMYYYCTEIYFCDKNNLKFMPESRISFSFISFLFFFFFLLWNSFLFHTTKCNLQYFSLQKLLKSITKVDAPIFFGNCIVFYQIEMNFTISGWFYICLLFSTHGHITQKPTKFTICLE